MAVPEGMELWSGVGLPECQRLAADLRNRTESFLYLDVSQLLKHALGLVTQLQARFDLYYMYYDWAGPESSAHWAEIARFAARVGTEVRFRSLTYQEVFAKLRAPESASEYLNYLESRYFKHAAEPPHAPDRLQRASPASAGDPTLAAERLESLEGVPLLPLDPEIAPIAEEMIRRAILPPNARTDALHIAIVAHHRIQYLLTWNCRHIANATILPRIHQLLNDLSIPIPIICTPEAMVSHDPESDD